MITPIGKSYNIQSLPQVKGNKKFSLPKDRVSFGSDITRVYKSSNAGDFFKILELFCLDDFRRRHKFKDILNRIFIKFSADFLISIFPKATLEELNMFTYAVKIGNNMAGGAILKKCPKEKAANIQFLVIDKKYQRKKESVKSIYKIVEQVIEDCRKDDINYVKWKVNKNNKNAYNMYKKLTEEQFSDGDISFFGVSLENLEKYIDNLKKNHPKLFN